MRLLCPACETTIAWLREPPGPQDLSVATGWRQIWESPLVRGYRQRVRASAAIRSIATVAVLVLGGLAGWAGLRGFTSQTPATALIATAMEGALRPRSLADQAYLVEPSGAPPDAEWVPVDGPDDPSKIPRRLGFATARALESLALPRSFVRHWVYPVAGEVPNFPLYPGAVFGSPRNGGLPGICGRGHCGVDLYAPRGAPVVAVLAGSVQWVERSVGKSSGRYVEINHGYGLSTYYMHLDSVRPDLERGVHVERGEFLGALGRSGIYSSPAHLHFGIRASNPRLPPHINPESLLSRAAVLGRNDVVRVRLATAFALRRSSPLAALRAE